MTSNGDQLPGLVRVSFSLEQQDGWPPFASEGLWAKPLGDDTYRVDNTPWFARNVAADDIVEARAGSDGVLWAISKIEWSGRLTIRVLVARDGPLDGDMAAVIESFRPLGVTGEGMGQYRLVALDIPPDTDLAAVKALLDAGVADGRWHFEEGCINDEWRAL
jgi:hypothetical protein